MTRQKPAFTPFADDAAVRTMGDFSIENGTARIALHGSLDIARDREGLRRAHDLRETLDAIVSVLEGEDLPEQVAEEPEAAAKVRNPFA
ncbi:hypothetical protein ASG52_24040 [Methylobacterium sp. Leaf456]|uniref:hypothetical protein n=1 Tax=Methylobacterium sp. Leaf456 TaxID=1736382 RepID=UPI0006FAE3D5|nr:hypothetical protein [Methylobacterium sp. Leaf456]KQT56256.1 hypothetical protein ASG52_24040 [Methylobacterium sp. Leaf456]